MYQHFNNRFLKAIITSTQNAETLCLSGIYICVFFVNSFFLQILACLLSLRVDRGKHFELAFYLEILLKTESPSCLIMAFLDVRECQIRPK